MDGAAYEHTDWLDRVVSHAPAAYEVDDIMWLLSDWRQDEVLTLREIYDRGVTCGWPLSKSTLRRRLKVACDQGMLHRAWQKNRSWRGWVYALRETMPTLFQLNEWSGSDDDIMEVL